MIITTLILYSGPFSLFISACSSSPCQNSGTCANTGSSFSCSCTAGYEGNQCTISEYAFYREYAFKLGTVITSLKHYAAVLKYHGAVHVVSDDG